MSTNNAIWLKILTADKQYHIPFPGTVLLCSDFCKKKNTQANTAPQSANHKRKACVPHYIHFAKRSKVQNEEKEVERGTGEEDVDGDRKRKTKD